MKNIYLKYAAILLFSFASCQEKEEDVAPVETCDTMATVQAVGGNLQLVLENGQVLLPANAQAAESGKDQASFEMDGFKVQAGQQIIIGYTPVAGTAARTSVTGKLVKVNCVVGFQQKSSK